MLKSTEDSTTQDIGRVDMDQYKLIKDLQAKINALEGEIGSINEKLNKLEKIIEGLTRE